MIIKKHAIILLAASLTASSTPSFAISSVVIVRAATYRAAKEILSHVGTLGYKLTGNMAHEVKAAGIKISSGGSFFETTTSAGTTLRGRMTQVIEKEADDEIGQLASTEAYDFPIRVTSLLKAKDGTLPHPENVVVRMDDGRQFAGVRIGDDTKSHLVGHEFRQNATGQHFRKFSYEREDLPISEGRKLVRENLISKDGQSALVKSTRYDRSGRQLAQPDEGTVSIPSDSGTEILRVETGAFQNVNVHTLDGRTFVYGRDASTGRYYLMDMSQKTAIDKLAELMAMPKTKPSSIVDSFPNNSVVIDALKAEGSGGAGAAY